MSKNLEGVIDATNNTNESTSKELETMKKDTVPATQLTGFAAMQAAKKKHVDTFKEGELLIPWLRIVQSTSGFIKKNKPEYVEGAQEGDIIDTVSRKLRATQQVIFVKYERHYTTWKPGGGKIVKQWFADPSGYNAASFPEGVTYGNKIDAEGNVIADTPTYYILAVDSETGACSPMTMAWGSTQAKKTRRLNALATADLADPNSGEVEPRLIYSTVFDIGTVPEQGNDKSWYGWSFSPGPLVWDVPKFGNGWLARAMKFREDIDNNLVRPQPPVDAEEANETESSGRRQNYGGVGRSGGSAPARTLDEDIPF
jgi:hypothetical protein